MKMLLLGVDDALVRETGIRVTPLFGGCVCCEISGDLGQAVEELMERIGGQ